ncbi:MAG: restriction endonuclease subunit R, partial [Candidatus Pacebacteria bacterium]|nr:restriction endonuclease subunit R [Candidatus Paceibacterota bacterium]
EGKNYFTILDFVKAYYHFADPEWDGEPIDQTSISDDKNVEKQEIENQIQNNLDDIEKESRPQKIKIELGEGKKRELWIVNTTMFYDVDGHPISTEEFLKNIFGKLPDFFKDEDKLKEIWANPQTREIFLKQLDELGYGKEQLKEFAKLINAENSDLFDVFEYISFDKKPLSRGERILQNKEKIFNEVDEQTREFLEFVLNSYYKDGIESLSEESFPTFLELKYGSLIEAKNVFSDLKKIKIDFLSLQEKLYI